MSSGNSKTCRRCGNPMTRQAQMFQMMWICTKCGVSE
jgi:ribosomal protein L37AE/L43A